MTEDTLRPATQEEISFALSYGLRFNTVGKANRAADGITASIVADMLVQHLDRSGFVVMKKPPALDSTPAKLGRPKR